MATDIEKNTSIQEFQSELALSTYWSHFDVNDIFLQHSVRHLNLLEFQSKNLLRENGVAIQNFCLLDKDDKSELNTFGELSVNMPRN